MRNSLKTKTTKLRIALRFNASSTIQHVATGHLMRCCRLAKELMKRGHDVTLWTNRDPLIAKLVSKSIKRKTVQHFSDLYPASTNLSRVDAIVIDMPDAPETDANTPALLKALSDKGISLIKLGHTGFVSRHYSAVISLYPTREIWTSNYYEGADYLVLDHKFRKHRQTHPPKSTSRVNEVFVCMGGTDLSNETSRALVALSTAKFAGHVTVALGAGNPNFEAVSETIKHEGLDATIHQAHTSIEKLMLPAQMAITAFGTTAYELMGLGVPSISLTHKSWQTPSAEAFARHNTTAFIGQCSDVSNAEFTKAVRTMLGDSRKRKTISKSASSMIDFRGVERVAAIVEQSARPRKPLDHLYVLAHPSDEALACAGTILSQTDNGQSVGLVILSDGYLARQDEGSNAPWKQKQAKTVTEALQASVARLGISPVYYYKLPDNEFDRVPLLDIIKVVEQVIDWHCPKNLYTNGPHDLNIDHQLTSRAVTTAARPLTNTSIEKLFYVDVPSSTDWGSQTNLQSFQPNWFEDISHTLEAKIEVIKLYGHELRPDPHPRSVNGIRERARHWGRAAGLKAAEAFQLVRAINKPADK